MATRTVYKDDKGAFFKGEGYKFRHPCLVPGTKVEVTSVNCGRGGARAGFKPNATSETIYVSGFYEEKR